MERFKKIREKLLCEDINDGEWSDDFDAFLNFFKKMIGISNSVCVLKDLDDDFKAPQIYIDSKHSNDMNIKKFYFYTDSSIKLSQEYFKEDFVSWRKDIRENFIIFRIRPDRDNIVYSIYLKFIEALDCDKYIFNPIDYDNLDELLSSEKINAINNVGIKYAEWLKSLKADLSSKYMSLYRGSLVPLEKVLIRERQIAHNSYIDISYNSTSYYDEKFDLEYITSFSTEYKRLGVNVLRMTKDINEHIFWVFKYRNISVKD